MKLTIHDIEAAVAALPQYELGYALGMWRYALQHANTPDADVPRSLRCDAIPYVPRPVDVPEGTIVLDVGCLGGYGLCDFYQRYQQPGEPPRAMGVDVDAGSIALAKALAPKWDVEQRVQFVEASCEEIPLDDQSVGLIVARLVLPYVDVHKTMAEFRRVLAPGGTVLLQLHAPGYYRGQMRGSWPHLRKMAYYGKPLLAGAWFGMTGRQIGREMALSVSGVERIGAKYGFVCAWSGGFAAKPIVLLTTENTREHKGC